MKKSRITGLLGLLLAACGILAAACGGAEASPREGENQESQAAPAPEEQTASPEAARGKADLLLPEWQEPLALFSVPAPPVQGEEGSPWQARGGWLYRLTLDQFYQGVQGLSGQAFTETSLPGVPLGPGMVDPRGNLLILTDNGYLVSQALPDSERILPRGQELPLGEVLTKEPLFQQAWTAPVLAGEGLFFLADSRLTLLSLKDQTPRWSRDLAGPEAPPEDLPQDDAFLAAGPGLLFYSPGGEEGGRLYDAETGDELWRLEEPLAGEPLFIKDRLFVPVRDEKEGSLKTAAFQAETGRQVWRETLGSAGERGSLISNGQVLALLLSGSEGRAQRMAAMDPRRGTLLWETPLPGAFPAGLAIDQQGSGRGLAVVSRRGIFQMLDLSTGKSLWQYEDLPGEPSGLTLSSRGAFVSLRTGQWLLFSQDEMVRRRVKDTLAAGASSESSGAEAEGGASFSQGDGGGRPADENRLPADGETYSYVLSGAEGLLLSVQVESSGTYHFYSPGIEEFPVHLILINDQGREVETNFEHSGLDEGFSFALEAGVPYQLKVEPLAGEGEVRLTLFSTREPGGSGDSGP